MAWVTPPTFVAGNVLTAAQLNILSGDLNETAPGKATAAGQIFVSTAANAVAARTMGHGNVSGAAQGTTSLSYVDLTTVGPSVTITTGATALAIISCEMSNDTINGYCEITYGLNGAAPATSNTLRSVSAIANARESASRAIWVSGLTPGSNTFKLMYRAQAGGTASFNFRDLVIMPID